MHRLEKEFAGRTLIMETGRMARQADAAVYVQFGDSAVLVTAVAERKRSHLPFFPLTIEYREKTYAAGKFPGGFIKRETRPGDKETVSARQIDRPLRPLFPDDYRNETQVACFVISADQENDADVLGMLGASAALSLSSIPWDGPIAGVRVGRVESEWIVNPTFEELDFSDMDIVVAGSEDSIVMVEGAALEIFDYEASEPPEGLEEAVGNRAAAQVRAALRIADKAEREAVLSELREEIVAALEEEYGEEVGRIRGIIRDLEKKEMRRQILEESVRVDGRGLDEIREITVDVGVLPRTHGSALFTRGQTQALCVTTLGTINDEQRIDSIDLPGETSKSFMLHYNFPPFSVGEVRMFRGPGRREIGHGMLAEKALQSLLPPYDDFPYTIRIVSDILESNGSSSMATVCGGSLALMDAGVPLRGPVAGIAMGLVKEGEEVAVLTDILGVEDALGDMDFKVAGTERGITSIQMDIKAKGLSVETMQEALERARKARLSILEVMGRTLSSAREEMSDYAPRIVTIQINPEKIGEIIGPKGKTIRGIEEKTGAKLNIEDTGVVTISAVSGDVGRAAREMVEAIVEEPEVGRIYEGVVKNTTTFGAFVEIIPGVEGLCHISELEEGRTERTEDVVQPGDVVQVKLLAVDERGRLKLSRRAAMNGN